jgi:prevent-host-death family protein
MATITLSASEFQDRVGEALDRSVSQPVLITKHGRPRNVVLSYDEYERLRARDRRAVRAEDGRGHRRARGERDGAGIRASRRRTPGEMTLAPRVGWLLSYSYLWANDHRRGAEEGIKNRPCALVAATRRDGDRIVAIVVPVSQNVYIGSLGWSAGMASVEPCARRR